MSKDMMTMFTVKYGEKQIKVAPDTTLREAVVSFMGDEAADIALVRVNGILRELNKKIVEDCELEMLSLESPEGRNTYKRSLNFLFLKAVHDLICDEDSTGLSDEYSEEPDVQRATNKEPDVFPKVTMNFSNGNGYYYTISDYPVPDASFAEKVKVRMQELVDLTLPIEKELMHSYDAKKMFRDSGMDDKLRLFKYRRISNINIYSLDGYRDYFYGYMVPDTGYLKWFDVCSYEDGLILVIPDFNGGPSMRSFEPFPKIFRVQQQSEKFAERIGINTVADLNDYITTTDIGHAQLVSEAWQESEIANMARLISERDRVKFVMIAGPSSSGKTTFSRRLSIQLTAKGLIPHPISLDNFYLNRDLCPRDENGELDFECLESIDVPLICETFRKLLAGETVELPRFSFITGKREYKGDFLTLGEKDVLVVEGIHGLNQKLVEGVDPDTIFRVYISAITQLNVDEHNHISTTDGRLLRRIVRDNRTRGTNAQETIAMWPSVRRGENRYIFPNQENADYIFNSALIYELSVLKTYAEPLLFQVPEDAVEYGEAKRLLKFLDYFLGTPSEQVPNNSILREFIGGSCFDV